MSTLQIAKQQIAKPRSYAEIPIARPDILYRFECVCCDAPIFTGPKSSLTCRNCTGCDDASGDFDVGRWCAHNSYQHPNTGAPYYSLPCVVYDICPTCGRIWGCDDGAANTEGCNCMMENTHPCAYCGESATIDGGSKSSPAVCWQCWARLWATGQETSIPC